MATVNKDNFQKKTTAKKERSKLSSVVTTGKVEAKKPSIKSKLADVFLSEERGNVGQYLIFDVLIPAIKDTVCNLGHAALDRSFYGEGRRYTNQSQTGSTYNYSSYYKPNYSHPQQNQPSDRYAHVNREGVFRFDTIEFGMRAEAQEVLDCLAMRIVDSDYATVADLYDLIGRTADFTMERWGWYNLDTAYVTNVRGGFVIRLPKPQPIK